MIWQQAETEGDRGWEVAELVPGCQWHAVVRFFLKKKTNNAEHDGGLGMAMLSLLKLILISTGLTCVRTRTSMGDEAIVVRVHDGGVEDPVHLDEPRGGPHKPPASAGQPQEPMPHVPVGHRSPVPALPLLDTRC